MKKRLLCAVMVLLLAVSVLPIGQSIIQAEEIPEGTFSLLDTPEPADFASAPANMYGEANLGSAGYEPRLLIEQNELVFMKYTEDEHYLRSYETTTGKLSGYIGSATMSADATSISYSGLKNLKNAEAIAFDPMGTGRNNHIAYYGFDADNGKLVLQIYNAETSKVIFTEYVVDSKLWCENQSAFQIANVIDITAGDYDKDGYDSIVVYVPYWNSPHLVEYRSNGSEIKKTGSVPVFDGTRSLTNYNMDAHTGDHSSTKYTAQPIASLTTGDFDGDGTDELATAISTGNTSESYIGHVARSDLSAFDYDNITEYTTQVSVLDRTSSGFSVSGKVQMLEQKNYSNYKTYAPIYQGNIATGNLDGDSMDEIVVVGYTPPTNYNNENVLTLLNGASQMFSGYGLQAYSDKSFASAVIHGDGKGGYSSSAITNHTMNLYTSDGTYFTEKKFRIFHPGLAVETAVMNGENMPASIFMAGDIYESNGMGINPGAVFSGKFDLKIDNTSNKGIAETFIYDVVAGNFDNNDVGREQFFFIAMQVHSSHENDKASDMSYSVVSGFYEGSYKSDTYDNAGNMTEVGDLGGYKSTDVWHDHSKNTRYLQNSKDPFSLVAVAADRDKDGVMGRFNEKSYSYADPEVLAVLQAAPYFAETDYGILYSTSGSTNYSVSTSHTLGTSSSDDRSWNFGITAGIEIEVPSVIKFQTSINTGYAGSSSKAYDNSDSVSYNQDFTVGRTDSVIVQRTPVVNYTYDVFDKSSNTWQENGMLYTYPLKPSTYSMTIDEYNDMVVQYLGIIEEHNKDAAKGDVIAPKLRTLTSEDLPEDTQGKPWNYYENFSQAKDGFNFSNGTSNSLSKNGGSTSSGWSQSSSSQVSTTQSNGFTFDVSATITIGGVTGGLYDGFAYNHSWGSYETTVSGSGASGSVTNLSASAIQQVIGVDNADVSLAIRDFGFNWEFGKWEVNLTDHSDTTLVFGYTTSGITRPAQKPTNVDVLSEDGGDIKLDSNGRMTLTWDAMNMTGVGYNSREYSPAALQYNVYMMEGSTAKKLNIDPVRDTEFVVTEPLEAGVEYKFYVTSVYENLARQAGESLPSKMISVTFPGYDVSLKFSAEVVQEADVIAKVNGKKVKTGRTHGAGASVHMIATAKAGYLITGYSVNGGQIVDIDPTAEYVYDFTLTENTDVVFHTDHPTRTINYGVNDASMGSISATTGTGVSFESGDKIQGTVSFAATTLEGYHIIGWKVDYGDGNVKNIRDARSTLTFTPTGDCTVTLRFAADDQSDITIRVNPTENGSIVVKDEVGHELTPNDAGEIHIHADSLLTFTAIPDDGYVFEYWTDDAYTVEKEDSRFDRTFTVTDEKNGFTVGAKFFAEVHNSVTYDALGNGDVDAESDSTQAVAGAVTAQNEPEMFHSKAAPTNSEETINSIEPGTQITFTATPDDGHYVEGWYVDSVKVAEGGETFTHTVDDDAHVVVKFDSAHITGIEVYSKAIPLSEREKVAVGHDDYRFGIHPIGGTETHPAVTWTLTGQSDAATMINERGELVVDENERIGNVLTVTATLQSDGSIADSYEVEVVQSYHELKVIGGTINGTNETTDVITTGSEVTITADDAHPGMEFVKWSVTRGSGVIIKGEKSEIATFIMPDGEVTMVAEYEHSRAGDVEDGDKYPTSPETGDKSDYPVATDSTNTHMWYLLFAATVIAALAHTKFAGKNKL